MSPQYQILSKNESGMNVWMMWEMYISESLYKSGKE